MRTTLIAAALGLLTLEGCGGAPSITPTAAVERLTLSGTVVSSAGGTPLSGATVTVLDGTNLGAASSGDSTGRYQIANLLPGSFTVQAASSGYQTVLKAVTLNTSGVLDFSLSKALQAALETVSTGASGVRQADGTYAVPIVGRNVGDGCAGNVRGSVDFSDAAGIVRVSLPWTLPGTAIVAPAAQFSFQACCLAADVAFTVPTATVQYAYETVACPK